ncbi:MAG: VOC family protein [Phycisphaerae bacterium]|nr:VOC family protein [Phycisphaerae bacterium]
MKFEHFGINVPDAAAMARWYVSHLGAQVVRALDVAPFTHFLADGTGRTIMEIYSNPADPIPDYSQQHHLRFHVAFVSDDPAGDKNRLTEAGASLVIEETTPDGSTVITLRDPWNMPIQLAKRTTPMP